MCMDIDTNAACIEYAKKHFNVDLPSSEAWTAVGKLDLDARASQVFVEAFLRAYPEIVKSEPTFRQAARPLFFAIVKYGAKQPFTDHWWAEIITKVLPVWTTLGAHDMSQAEADILAPLLRPHLTRGERLEKNVASMLCSSSALWKHLGDAAVRACSARQRDVLDPLSELNTLLHRYQPQKVFLDANDTKSAYGNMCGWFHATKPTLVEMRTILMPLHNCAKAWGVALSACKEPSAGTWMELYPAFSSLVLEPGDASSWDVVAHLHEKARSDSSCAQLVKKLGGLNPTMENNYVKLWPAISTMYAGKDRSAAAVQLWMAAPQNDQESFQLPGLALN